MKWHICCFLLQTSQGKSFCVTALFDTDMDVILFQHGGLLRFVARTLLWNSLKQPCFRRPSAFNITTKETPPPPRTLMFGLVSPDFETLVECQFWDLQLLHHYTRLFEHLTGRRVSSKQPRDSRRNGDVHSVRIPDNSWTKFLVFYHPGRTFLSSWIWVEKKFLPLHLTERNLARKGSEGAGYDGMNALFLGWNVLTIVNFRNLQIWCHLPHILHRGQTILCKLKCC